MRGRSCSPSCAVSALQRCSNQPDSLFTTAASSSSFTSHSASPYTATPVRPIACAHRDAKADLRNLDTIAGGSKYGVQVKNSAFLLEPGRRQRRRAASEGRTARGIWSSDSDPELDAFIQDELARRNAQGTRYWRPRSERGGELEQQSLGKEGAKRKKTKRRSRRREALGG